MLSPKTIHNSTDGTRDHRVPFGDLCEIVSGCRILFDFDDILVREFSCNTADSKAVGVPVISRSVNPFKIGDDAVGLNGIDVVDLRKVLRVWDERHGHQLVDLDISGVRRIAQPDGGISLGVRASAQQFSPKIPMPFFADTVADHCLADPIQTSHSPQIADFVEVGEFWNRDATPLFDDAHGMGSIGEVLASRMLAQVCHLMQ